MTEQTMMERAVLGQIISGDDYLNDEIFSNVASNHFEDVKNKSLYSVLQEMYADKKFIDFLTVESEVRSKNLSKTLPHEFIVDTMAQVGTGAHIRGYIKILKRNAYIRQIKLTIMQLNPEASPEAVDGLMSLIQARDGADRQAVTSPEDFTLDHIKDMKTKKSAGISTGYHTLDNNIHCQAGDLVVIGARTNVGKTTYLTNILVNMLVNNIPCLYVPTEMRPKQFLDRMIPIVGDVSAYNIRSRQFTDGELKELDTTAEAILKMPVKFLDIAGPNIQDVAQAIKTSGCKVLFLDYLGRCSMPKENTRMREIEKFIVSLKNLCVEKEVLCFLAVQLSRATDYNKDSEPRLADLSDSSAIEKEADAVIFLWKDPKDNIPTGTVISAVIAKNRHGILSSFKMDFIKRKMKMIEQGQPIGRDWNEPQDLPQVSESGIS